jgi:hypothetical protein
MTKTDKTIAIAAYLAIKEIGKPSTVGEIYKVINRLSLYKFGTPSASKDIGVLGLSIKRHMSNSRRNDKAACLLFRSFDGFASNASLVTIIKSAPKQIALTADLLLKAKLCHRYDIKPSNL